jgi:hypothetical protein
MFRQRLRLVAIVAVLCTAAMLVVGADSPPQPIPVLVYTNQPVVPAPEYWTTVPAPVTAPADQVWNGGFAHYSDYTWFYPFQKPTPGCTLTVRNCIVDTDGKMRTLSAATVLNVQSGWRLWGGSWNQPIVENGEGIIWIAEISNLNPADDFQYNPYKNGTKLYLHGGFNGTYPKNTSAPYAGHNHYLTQLMQDPHRIVNVEDFESGGADIAAAPAPVVIASQLTNVKSEFAYCRVAETGQETALSPAFVYQPKTLPEGTSPSATCWVSLVIKDFHPQGTLGLHVYRREKVGVDPNDNTVDLWSEWKRVPAPHCHGTPTTPDDWLFPYWQRQFSVLRTVADAPLHQTAAAPKSRLSRLHRLLRGDIVKDADVLFEYFRLPDTYEVKTTPPTADQAVAVTEVLVKKNYNPDYVNVVNNVPVSFKKLFVGDVVVKAGERFTVTCPVIDEWGNGDSGTTGGPDQQKFWRRIRSENYGDWYIDQAPSQAGHTSWPVLCILNSYSRWQGVNVNAKGGDALTYSDYSGGQCFGNQFIGCRFQAQPVAGRVTCGIRMDYTCTSSGHHPSEQLFEDCYVNGSIGALLGGNQAANLRFKRLHINSTSHDSRGCVFAIDYNPNPIQFTDGLYCDAYLTNQPQDLQRGVIFRVNGHGATLKVADIWCDAGFIRFIEATNCPVQLSMRGGKLNVRGTKPVFALFIGHPNAKSTLFVEDVQIQRNTNTSIPYVINNDWRRVEVLTERTALQDMILREPSEATMAARFAKIFSEHGPITVTPVEEPGYRVNVDVEFTFEVPSVSIRARTAAEITTEMNALVKIKNLPEWGKVFFKDYYLKYTLEPTIIKVPVKKTVTSIFNSLTTGKKIAREIHP